VGWEGTIPIFPKSRACVGYRGALGVRLSRAAAPRSSRTTTTMPATVISHPAVFGVLPLVSVGPSASRVLLAEEAGCGPAARTTFNRHGFSRCPPRPWEEEWRWGGHRDFGGFQPGRNQPGAPT